MSTFASRRLLATTTTGSLAPANAARRNAVFWKPNAKTVITSAQASVNWAPTVRMDTGWKR